MLPVTCSGMNLGGVGPVLVHQDSDDELLETLVGCFPLLGPGPWFNRMRHLIDQPPARGALVAAVGRM